MVIRNRKVVREAYKKAYEKGFSEGVAAQRRVVGIIESIDKLLDDIDPILKESAEEFVASFVQRGGE